MPQSEYRLIEKICTRYNKNRVISSIAYAVYEETLASAIADYVEVHKAEPSPSKMATMKQTLTTESSVLTFVQLAERQIADLQAAEVNKYRRGFRLKEFLVNALSSVLGAFIYSIILLLLILALSQDTFATLIMKVIKAGQKTEQSETRTTSSGGP